MHLLKNHFISSILYTRVLISSPLFFVLVFIWTHVSVLICTFFFSCVAVLLGKSGNTGEKRPLKLYTYHAFIDSFVETCSSIPSFTSLLFYLLPLSKCFRTFQPYKQMIQKSIKTLKKILLKSKIITQDM